jgi:predicted SprT family Zn-dependent metalloprotease
MQITLQKTKELGVSLLRQHGLLDWSFTLDHAKARAGLSNFTKKQISVSREYAQKVTEKELVDTILHEIAHALTGHHHGHDSVWKKTAISIGCSGKRCHETPFSVGQIERFCPKGCFSFTQHRKPSKIKLCRKCKSPAQWRFVQNQPSPPSSPISCQFCNENFTDSLDLKKHQENKCEDIPMSLVLPSTTPCQFCFEKFNNQDDLSEHQKTCEEMPISVIFQKIVKNIKPKP